MAKLSVLILTKNEEKNIADCIESAKFAHEIVVIDSGSTDQTCRLAEEHGAKVVIRPMGEEGFAGQRNFAVTQASGDWVFYLDADERVSKELGEDILAHINDDTPRAAIMPRHNIVMDKLMRYGVYRPDDSLRLFPKAAVRWTGIVHEEAHTDVPTVRLNHPIYHRCITSWEQYFNKFNDYTALTAQKLYQQGKKTNILSGQSHALFSFFRMYVLKKGFLDGWQGLLLCIFHYFFTLTKYVKLYYLHKQE